MQVNSFQSSIVFKEALFKVKYLFETIIQLQYLLELIKKVKFIKFIFI